MDRRTLRPSRADTRSYGTGGMLSAIVGSWRDRPEPFKPPPYRVRRRTRWALWTFVSIAAAGAVGLVTLMGDSRPSAPSSPVNLADVNVVSGPMPQETAAVFAAEPTVPETHEQHLPTLPPADPEPPRPPEPPRAERQVVTTAQSGANMRAAPSPSGAVLWRAPRGTALRVIGEEGRWLHVATPSGERTGWMHRSVVDD